MTSPFDPAEIAREISRPMLTTHLAVVELRLHEMGYGDVLVVEQDALPGAVLFISSRPHRADEALYAVEKKGYRPPGILFVDFDMFCRMVVAHQYREIREQRLAHPFLGPFWALFYTLFPEFGRTL